MLAMPCEFHIIRDEIKKNYLFAKTPLLTAFSFSFVQTQKAAAQ